MDGAAKRVLGMVIRAIVQAVDDSGPFQKLKLSGLAEEVRDGVVRFAQYGFTSNPPPDSDAIGVALGGSREGLVIVATDSKGRPKSLLVGEACIYNVVTGESVLMKADGTIRLGADATDPVVRKSDLDALVSKYNTHTHTVSSAPGTSAATLATHTGTASAKVFAK